MKLNKKLITSKSIFIYAVLSFFFLANTSHYIKSRDPGILFTSIPKSRDRNSSPGLQSLIISGKKKIYIYFFSSMDVLVCLLT